MHAVRALLAALPSVIAGATIPPGLSPGRLSKAVIAVLLAAASSGGAGSSDPVRPFAPYAGRSQFMPAVPGANGGLYGFVNPAVLTHVRGLESTFAWSDRGPGGRQ